MLTISIPYTLKLYVPAGKFILNVTDVAAMFPPPTALRRTKTPLLSETVFTTNGDTVECPAAFKFTCDHNFVLQSWYFTNTQTASQFAGATLAFQLFSHAILNVMLLPETAVPEITTLFALALKLSAKKSTPSTLPKNNFFVFILINVKS